MRKYYNRYRRNLTAPEASGTLQAAIDKVAPAYKELGANQEIVEVGGVKTGESANPNVSGTVAVARGTAAPRNFKIRIHTRGANTAKPAVLFDALGTHGGSCDCNDAGADLAEIENIGCNNYMALTKLSQFKNIHLDTLRIKVKSVAATPVAMSASDFQIDVSRRNSEGVATSQIIDFFDHVDEKQFDQSMATVPLGANDSKGLIDYGTQWKFSSIPPDVEIIVSGKIGLVTSA